MSFYCKNTHNKNNNYIIEENIDFYSELNKELNNDNNIDISNNILDNTCLITYEPLEENHVTLDCNHKFNYLPFVNAINIDMQTYTYNSFLKYELKCPYCRNIHVSRPIKYDYRYTIYLPHIHPPHDEIKFVRKEIKRLEKEQQKAAKKAEQISKRNAAKLEKKNNKNTKPNLISNSKEK